MPLKLKDYASIAEIIASIAVISSLIFVALELNEGNREARAVTTQLAVQSEMNMATAFLEHADTWDKTLTGQPLQPGAETREAILMLNLFMLDTASRYQQFRSGYLEPSAWAGRTEILPDIIDLPIYATWRESSGARNQPTEFLEYLDSLASNRKQSSTQ